MANTPENYLSGLDAAFQSKTLFLPAPGRLGVLVSKHGRRRAAKELQFAGAEAALAWCQARRVNLVYFFNAVRGN